MLQIVNAIRPAFEHLELVVETFDEPTGTPVQEVIGDLLQPGFQGLGEGVEEGEIFFARE